MSFLLTEAMQGRVIEISVSGKLTKEAYQEFVPYTEEAIQKYGRIRIVFITLGFEGWDAGALWEDVKFDLKHFRDIERLAIVGETKWEKGMATFCRPFTTAIIKFFEHSDLEKAREWVQEGL
jgi:hypothetical protein